MSREVCQFEPVNEVQQTCPHCRVPRPISAAIRFCPRPSGDPARAYIATPPPPIEPPKPLCALLGAELRRVECRTCCGRTKLKVFACTHHGGECSPSSQAGVRSCGDCAEHVAASEGLRK